MGRFAYREIEPITDKDVALDDGIEVIDLEGLGYLSQLNLNFRAIAVDNDDIGVPVPKIVTKLEVLANGSSIIKSYSSDHCKAIAAYSGIDLATQGYYCRHGTEEKTFWRFPLLFGRYPGDPRYMLDTNAFESLQAKIHWNAADETHDGASYDASGDPDAAFFADAMVYEGGAPPGNMGYIKTMEINRYAIAENTRYPTEIPRGYPLRGITTRFCYTADQWAHFYDKFKLNFDNGKWIPIDGTPKNLQSMLTHWWPKVYHSTLYADVDGGVEFDTGVGIVTGFTGSSGNQATMGEALNHGPEMGLSILNIWDSANTAEQNPTGYILSTWGMMPMQVMYWPMWKFADIDEDAVPTADYKRIDFEHTTITGAGAGTATICGEYLVPQGQTQGGGEECQKDIARNVKALRLQ